MKETNGKNGNGFIKMRFGLILTGLGFFIFTLGAAPEFYGLDRSPVVGFVQITVFLLGLGIICIGGNLSMSALWAERERSLAADIGLRLVATGYVISVITGMADVFGVGNQPWPEIPSFGFWQSTGVIIGQIIIAIGFLLMIPPHSINQEELT
ncbi:MAG TPA: hypothetical protein DEH25_01660 [Chloroflexi bacterium]|nr:hypothetical protein [Chloroflexota bacterium]HBY06891.1 hypothetical protein [Chloroflexota bacterium]